MTDANADKTAKKDANKDLKQSGKKEVDYLHPDGAPVTKPHNAQEAKNEKEAKELTEIAEELKVDK